MFVLLLVPFPVSLFALRTHPSHQYIRVHVLLLLSSLKSQISRDVASRNDWTFVSGSRSLLRLLWFLDFVALLLAHILEQPGAPLKDAASVAYEAALSPHHPWILRKTIHAALHMLPTKETFLK